MAKRHYHHNLVQKVVGNRKGVVNVLTDLPRVTEIAAGSGSEVYRDLLGGGGGGAITNENEREIQNWGNQNSTEKWTIESVINCPIVVIISLKLSRPRFAL